MTENVSGNVTYPCFRAQINCARTQYGNFLAFISFKVYF